MGDLFDPVRARIRALDRATVGVVVLDDRGTVLLAERADEPFPAASVIKLPIAMALFADAAERRVDLRERLAIGEIVGGSGVLGTLRDIADLSVHDLAVLMTTVSDNTAANRVMEKVGIERVNARMREWGCASSVLGRRLYDLEARKSGRENRMTPAETAGLLLRLVRGECVDRSTSDAVLALLEATQSHTPLRRYLHPDARIAHKPGWLQGVRNDAAILWADRPVIVAAFARGLSLPDPAPDLFALLGWCAYQAAGGAAPPLPAGAFAGA